MRYRVEQLAATCDVSVDTVRYYQSKGLLPPPAREGRVAVYGDEHATRLSQIRALQRKGLSLAVIRRALSGSLGRGDADLAAAIAGAQADGDPEELLTLEQLAERSRVPTAVLATVEREGLRLGRTIDGTQWYTAADVDVVRHGLRLLEAGLPINELLALATRYDALAREIAEHAVDLFDRHIREPIRASGVSDDEAAGQLVHAFDDLLPAVTALVAHHFKRALLQTAQAHLEHTSTAPARRTARRRA